ncbi:MAG: DUF2057 family protein [Verrucomicrobiota bacterium]
MNILKSFLWLAALIMFTGGCASTSIHRIADAGVAPDRIVSVWIPVMLEPLTIDDRPVDRDLIPTTTRYRYELAPGVHKIVVRYSGFTDIPEQVEIVRSLPVFVTMNGLPGHHYVMNYDAHAGDIRLGKTDFRPNVSIVDITTNTALIRSWKGSAQPGQSPVLPKEAVPVIRPDKAPVVSSTNIPSRDAAISGALVQLQQSWRQADESDRGEFMQWIVLRTNPSVETSSALHQLQEAWQKAAEPERRQFLKWTVQMKNP